MLRQQPAAQRAPGHAMRRSHFLHNLLTMFLLGSRVRRRPRMRRTMWARCSGSWRYRFLSLHNLLSFFFGVPGIGDGRGCGGRCGRAAAAAGVARGGGECAAPQPLPGHRRDAAREPAHAPRKPPHASPWPPHAARIVGFGLGALTYQGGHEDAMGEAYAICAAAEPLPGQRTEAAQKPAHK